LSGWGVQPGFLDAESSLDNYTLFSCCETNEKSDSSSRVRRTIVTGLLIAWAQSLADSLIKAMSGQLELCLGNSGGGALLRAGARRAQRAHWWFERMRQAAEPSLGSATVGAAQENYSNQSRTTLPRCGDAEEKAERGSN